MNSRNIVIVAVGAFFLSSFGSSSAGEKLKVFILAGQSNTVGHARGHTIATLYKSDEPRDEALTGLVFRDNVTISKDMDEQLARAKKIDELSGGIGFPKIKQMPDGPEKKALQAQVDELVAAHEAYKQSVIDACAVSDRVYIASIADRNNKSGKLGVGYGADGVKIGPEYGFGLSMAQKVKGPILLIKASWGGKSLMYDFRPPSAQDFEKTRAYANMVEKDKQRRINHEEAVRTFPERMKAYEADLAAYNNKLKTATDEEKKKLREPRKPRTPPGELRPANIDNAGFYWNEMVKHAKAVLADPGKHHPDYDPGQGYEIAGFVWFQGYNDQFDPEFSGNYTDNMRTFIRDVRTTFKTPKMPFVIGVLGTGRIKEKVDENAVSIAQRKAAKHPEFKGNVLSVESYKDYSNYSYSIFEKGWPPHYHEMGYSRQRSPLPLSRQWRIFRQAGRFVCKRHRCLDGGRDNSERITDLRPGLLNCGPPDRITVASSKSPNRGCEWLAGTAIC